MTTFAVPKSVVQNSKVVESEAHRWKAVSSAAGQKRMKVVM